MPDVVVVINIHGGFPSAMINRSMRELDGFAQLEATSEVYERVYPTNACAGPALHDTVMDAPIGTMTDSIWHAWAHGRHATRSLFHIFQQHGYHTKLFGAFGLDARLDPHAHMHVNPLHLSSALQMYGIDECDAQDAAFTCQLAFAYDQGVLQRVVDYIERSAHSKSFIVVNLLGCQDAHKCTFRDVDPERVSIPVMHFEREGDAFDERIFSENVINDDPRNQTSAAHAIDPLRRAAVLKDWIRGQNGVDEVSREELVRTVTGLHRFCWKCIQQIDRGLLSITNALDGRSLGQDTALYVYSDHVIGLYEHGELCETPWESCLRSFLIRRSPTVVSSRVSTPLSLANLPTMIMHDCNIYADWHVQPMVADCCVTLGLALSWLARASMEPCVSALHLRTLFIRCLVHYNDRYYAVTLWFSLVDLAKKTGVRMDRDDIAQARLLESKTRWANPMLGSTLTTLRDTYTLQVYEHVTDPHEADNLAAQDDWLRTTAAHNIKAKIDESLRHHHLSELHLIVPESVHTLGPERVTFCSVQLHHRIRDRIRPPIDTAIVPVPPSIRSVGTQTEEPSFANALNRAFGCDLAQLISTQLRNVDNIPLTIFAPDDVVNTTTWPNWAPLPLKGAYTGDNMLHAAREDLPLIDAVNGMFHKLTPDDDDVDSVFFQHCRVLLRSATNIFHSKGFAIGYRVFRRNEGKTQPLLRANVEPPGNIGYDFTSDAASDASLRARSSKSRSSIQNGVKQRARNAGGSTATRGSVKAMELGQLNNRR